MADKLPWFPFYPDRWETDAFVRTSDFTEHGILLALMCWQWREGSIPADEARLERGLSMASRGHGDMAVLRKVLVECFESHPTKVGQLVNVTLHEIRERQEVKASRLARAGRKGGLSKARARLRKGHVESESEVTTEPKRQTDLGLAVASQKRQKTKQDSPNSPAGAAKKHTWLTPYDELWRRHFDAALPFGPAAKALAPLEQEHGAPAVLRGLANYLAAHTGERASFLSWPKFASTFGQWLNPTPATRSTQQSRSFDAIDRALGGDDGD